MSPCTKSSNHSSLVLPGFQTDRQKNLGDFSSKFHKFLNTHLLHTRPAGNERGGVWHSFRATLFENGFILKKLWVFEVLLVKIQGYQRVLKAAVIRHRYYQDSRLVGKNLGGFSSNFHKFSIRICCTPDQQEMKEEACGILFVRFFLETGPY